MESQCLSYQNVLDVSNAAIISVIPSPTILLPYQVYQIFTPWEEERIKEEENENGAERGSTLLLQLLRKKGEKSFHEFLRILQEPTLHLESLHCTLSQEYRKQCFTPSGQEEHLPNRSVLHKHGLNPDNFLKDIPPRISTKLVRQLNIHDTLGNDWRGIADCLNLTHEETIESSNKMGDMLDIMIQRNHKVKDMLQMLKKIKRYDIIELFTYDEKWLRTEEKSTQTASVNCDDVNSGDTNQTPCRTESVTCFQEKYFTKIVNTSILPCDKKERQSQYCAASKQAFILANGNYKDLKKVEGLDTCVKDLEKALQESEWNVSCTIDCPWKEIKIRCDNFLKVTRQSVVLLYYIGHSIQVYSDNYLLPVDISIDDTKADIVLKSLKLSSLLHDLKDSLCSIVIIDSGYKTGLACPEDCIVDGLSTFEPPLRSVVSLICSSGQARKEESKLSYVRCFTECLKKKPAYLRSFLNEVEENLPIFTDGNEIPSPVTLCKTKELLPISLNNEVLEKHTETFLVKKSALILVEEGLFENSLNRAPFQELCNILKTMLWEVCLIMHGPNVNVYQEIKSFLKQPDSEMKIVFLFGTFCQSTKGNCLVLNNSSLQEAAITEATVSIQWIIDSMCILATGYKVLILEDITPNNKISLADIDCPPQMLISVPRNGSYRKRSTYCQDFADMIQQSPTLEKFRDFMFTIGKRQDHTIHSNFFLL